VSEVPEVSEVEETTSLQAVTQTPAAVAVPRGARAFDPLQLLLRYGLLALIVGVIAYFAVTEPAFRTVDNTFSILQSVAIVGIIALGVTFSLVINGFDLSVGANAGMAAMLSSIALVIFDASTAAAVVVALAAGALVGLANGIMIVRFHIPDLLATLGMMFLVQGLQLLPSAGQTVATGMQWHGKVRTGVFHQSFLDIARKQFGPVPLPVLIFLGLAALVWIFLEKTRWGRVMYAIGGNPEAVRLAGIRIDRYRFAAYLISGTFAAIGGIMLAARIGAGDVGSGNPYLLQAVATALIGYAVLAVNKPNPLGTTVGAVFLGVLLNGLTIKNFPYYTQDFITGVVLVVALFLSFAFARRR
jgi:simple sugar transport system permease protein